MNVRDFEEGVWQMETIRIVIRAEWDEEVGDYPWERAASGSTTLNEFLHGRIIKHLQRREFVVIGGHGIWPNGNTDLRTIRASYE